MINELIREADERPEDWKVDLNSWWWIHKPSNEHIRIDGGPTRCRPSSGPGIPWLSKRRLWAAYQRWCENRPLVIQEKQQ